MGEKLSVCMLQNIACWLKAQALKLELSLGPRSTTY